MKPLFDNVIIKPVEAEHKLPSGLELPESSKEKPQLGEVLKVGPDIKGMVEAGDKVFYKKWAGSEVTHDGNKVIIIQEKELLAVL